jgi:hypothetical protein
MQDLVGSMSRTRAITAVCAAFAMGAAACGGGARIDLPSSHVGQSSHFDYWARASDTHVCPDVLATLERHFATLQGYLGFSWPSGARVSYYKYADDKDFTASADCGSDAGGCERGPSVFTTEALDTHELVHAYLSATGEPPPVLVEGVAVALSCTAHGYEKPTLGWQQLAAVPPGVVDPVTAYDAGGWLVGYLLDELGPQRFITLYGSIGARASSAEMDAAFQRVYGQSFAAIWAAALAEDQPRNTCVWQCSGAPLPLDGTTVDTAGACGPDITRTFSLASDATLSFTLDGPTVSLGPCSRARVPGSYLNGALSGGMLALYRLAAGSYFLTHDPNAGTIVGRADASAALGPSCPAATDVAQLDRAYVYVALPPSTSPWFLPVPAPAPAGGQRLLAQPTPDTAGATLCASCGATSCEDVSQPRAWTQGQVLELTPDPAHDFSEYMLSWL